MFEFQKNPWGDPVVQFYAGIVFSPIFPYVEFFTVVLSSVALVYILFLFCTPRGHGRLYAIMARPVNLRMERVYDFLAYAGIVLTFVLTAFLCVSILAFAWILIVSGWL